MALAQTEMFLFFTALVKEFRIEEEPGAPLPPPTPTMGFVMGCPDYLARLVPRTR